MRVARDAVLAGPDIALHHRVETFFSEHVIALLETTVGGVGAEVSVVHFKGPEFGGDRVLGGSATGVGKATELVEAKNGEKEEYVG